MPRLFRKISDYDRIAKELEDTKEKLAETEEELRKTKSELEKVRNQLDHAQERAKEERRKRADEEARRGEVEKQLKAKLKEMEDLTQRLSELVESGQPQGGSASLERESEVDPERVSAFVNETEFEGAGPCLTAAIPSANSQTFLSGIPGMESWAERIARHNRGLVVFASGQKACVFEPPLPVESEDVRTGSAFDFSLLKPLLERPLVGFVSIHRDLYTICLLNGEVRNSIFKERDVLGKTSKGGFSQARYARFRDDQFKHLLVETNEAAKRIFSGADPSYILVEGDDRTVSALSEMKGILREHRLVRFTIRGKISKRFIEKLPRSIWRWRAWAFDLPSPIFHPRG